jgi:hypothetical protein
MNCVICSEETDLINEDLLCLKCFNDDKYVFENPLCMTCGKHDELVENMYCSDCFKRQRFMFIFDESKSYLVGSYFGKHLLEKWLGYYVSEQEFVEFMKQHGFKYNESKRCFRTKINKKRTLNILGVKI